MVVKSFIIWQLLNVGEILGLENLPTIIFSRTRGHFFSGRFETPRKNPHFKIRQKVRNCKGWVKAGLLSYHEARGINNNYFKGRKEGTLTFLSKEENKKALDYLKKGYNAIEISKLTGVQINTITKIKKLKVPELNKAVIYIDEFGNPHLDLSKEGTFSHFVYTSVIINKEDTKKARDP